MTSSGSRAVRLHESARSDWRYSTGASAVLVLAGLWLARHRFGVDALVPLYVIGVLVALSLIDLRDRILPNRIVLPSAAAVLVAQLALHPDRALEWVVSALGAALFLFLPVLVYPSGMGMGDVKLALLMGAALGYAVPVALMIGLAGAAVVGLVLLSLKGRTARKIAMPFGPFLALGTIVTLFLAQS